VHEAQGWWQARSQHTPPAQLPERQSIAILHVSPPKRLPNTQRPLAQREVLAQSSLCAQSVVQVIPSGAHL
jgi:hypothetical protein